MFRVKHLNAACVTGLMVCMSMNCCSLAIVCLMVVMHAELLLLKAHCNNVLWQYAVSDRGQTFEGRLYCTSMGTVDQKHVSDSLTSISA